jgi:hypothetical protein
MQRASASAEDTIGRGWHVIKVRVGELRQLFNAIDPSPFRERDLDPRVEEFIVEWAGNFPRHVRLSLVVHLERGAGRADEAALLGDAIHQYFHERAASTRRKLRELFGRGRISLLIGLAFLAASMTVGDALASYFRESRFAVLLREGFVIGGWVAMWRPLEIFLYDWWPIRAEVRLFERLSTMPVEIEYQETASADAWRSDWPAVPAANSRPTPAPADTDSGLVRRVTVPGEPRHEHTPQEERRIRETALDQTIEGSFPASDPPSSNPNPDDHASLERRRPNLEDARRHPRGRA